MDNILRTVTPPYLFYAIHGRFPPRFEQPQTTMKQRRRGEYLRLKNWRRFGRLVLADRVG